MISACSGNWMSPARRRYAPHEYLEQFGHTGPGLGADEDRVGGLDPDDVLDLFDHAFGLGRRQVDLVDDRHHLEALLECRVAVRDALRLNALCRVHDQQRALACGERTRHFVREVDVPWRVDEVELVVEPVHSPVVERDGLRLDRDATLALEVHRVQHLFLHLARLETPAGLYQAVGQRRLAVVDVRNDREIAYLLLHREEGDALAGPARPGKKGLYQPAGADFGQRRAVVPDICDSGH